MLPQFSEDDFLGNPQSSGELPLDSLGSPLPKGVNNYMEQQTNDDEGPGFWGTLADGLYSIPGGVVMAAEETLNFGRDAINWFDDALGIDKISNDVSDRWDFGDYIYEPETAFGDLTQNVTRFLTGFVGAKKLLAPVKFLGKANGFVRAMTEGAVTDAVVYDPHEARFANFLDHWPQLANPVTEYLRADENDSNAEGRLKNVLEGMMLGTVSEALFGVVRGMKLRRAGKITEEELSNLAADYLNKISGGAEITQEMTDTLAAAGINVAGLKGGFKPAAIDVEKTADLIRTSLKDGTDIRAYDPATHINFLSIDDSEELMRTIQAVSDPLLEAVRHKGQDVFTFIEANKEALHLYSKMLGEDPDKVLVMLQRWGREAEELPVRALATMNLARSSWNHIQEKLAAYTADSSMKYTGELMAEIETAIHISLEAKRMVRGGARTVTFQRIFNSGMFATDSVSIMQEALAKFGPSEKLTGLLNKMRLAENAEELARVTLGSMSITKGRAVINAVNEVWINGLLSSVKTHVVNMVSTALETTILPAEKIIGGMMAKDSALMREGLNTYLGYAHMLGDAWRMAKKSFRLDDNVLKSSVTESVLDPTGRVAIDKALSASSLKMREDSLLGKSVTWLGKMLNIPSRFLVAEDEFAAQLYYRATMYARLKETAIEKGFKSAADIKQFIADNMDAAFTKRTLSDGTVIQGKGIVHDVLEEAKRTTFSTELERGLGKSLQDLPIKHPLLKPLLPFIKTPTNLIRNVWQRTPLLNRLQFQYAQMLRGGDERYLAELMKQGGEAAVSLAKKQYAIAQGRAAVGGMMWATAGIAAMSGTLTGSGPQDSRARAMLQETGWQPYSIKVGDKFVQYNRLDPFGMFIGLAADLCEIIQQSEGLEGMEIAGAAVSMVAKNLSSKTYLRGMVEAMNAITGDDDARNEWLTRTSASFLPYSALSAQIRGLVDDEYKELQGVIDHMKNKIPGLSSTLPAKYSWITGEVQTMPDDMAILPTPWRTRKDDVVLQEMAHLDYGFAAPPKRLDGVDLTTQQISDFNRLHGQIKIGGLTLHDRLRKVMDLPQYDIKRERYPDSPDGLSSKRLEMVLNTIAQYRAVAKRELLKEHPKLARDILQARTNKRLAVSGDMEKIAQIIQK